MTTHACKLDSDMAIGKSKFGALAELSASCVVVGDRTNTISENCSLSATLDSV